MDRHKWDCTGHKALSELGGIWHASHQFVPDWALRPLSPGLDGQLRKNKDLCSINNLWKLPQTLLENCTKNQGIF